MPSILTIEFPSDEHRDGFTGWLSNSGEQDHCEQGNYVEANERHLYHLNFDYSKDEKIVATEVEE